MANKFVSVLKKTGNYIKDTVLTKRAGFFVGAGACLFAIAAAIAYANAPSEIYDSGVIVWLSVGIVLFLVLSLFKITSSVAPFALMVCSTLSLFPFAFADGLIDYIGTQFFDGVSVQKIFSLPAGFLLSILFLLITIIASSVAIYLKQNKTDDNKAVEQSEAAQAGEKA